MNEKAESADAANASAGPGPLTPAALFSAMGATLLIASEFVVVALALDWSVTGVLGLGRTAAIVGAAILAPFLLYGCWWTFRHTLAVERAMPAGQ